MTPNPSIEWTHADLRPPRSAHVEYYPVIRDSSCPSIPRTSHLYRLGLVLSHSHVPRIADHPKPILACSCGGVPLEVETHRALPGSRQHGFSPDLQLEEAVGQVAPVRTSESAPVLSGGRQRV